MSDKSYNTVVRRGTVVIPTSNTVTTGTNTEILNGRFLWLEWVTANMQDTDSTRLRIIGEDGGTFHDTGTVAESTRFTTGTEFPVAGTVEVVAVAEGTQSAARDVAYSFYIRE